MKFKRKQSKTEVNEMSTAALPDIVFMLLFFFMVTTVMRKDDPMVTVDRPMAKEIVAIKDASTTATIFIGRQTVGSDEKSRIQIGNEFVALSDIGPIVTSHIALLPENLQSKFTVILKADKNIEMGIISNAKQELRKINVLKIQYSTLPKKDVLATI
ncbi:MAG: biopolymer transporter ExbD [Flavobacteriales bacterium]|nr:biopolymer transporter ExbD [Flavobacteriales bacterium]